MAQSERLALAIIRSGRSYDEAAQASHLSINVVIALWKANK